MLEGLITSSKSQANSSNPIDSSASKKLKIE